MKTKLVVGMARTVAFAACTLVACSPARGRTAPGVASPPSSSDVPPPASSSSSSAPSETPQSTPLVLVPTSFHAAISYRAAALADTWLEALVRAAVDAQLPSVGSEFGSQCGMVPIRRISQLDVDLRYPSSEVAEPDVSAVLQLNPELDPRHLSLCIAGRYDRRFQVSNGIVSFAWSPQHSPVVIAYTEADKFIVAASAAGSLNALGDAVRRGLVVRSAPALTGLTAQVPSNSVAWVAIVGGDKASEVQAALGIRPLSLLAWATFDGSLSATARLRLSSADEARKAAAMARAQVSKLGRFEGLEVNASDAEVVVRVVMTQAQAEALVSSLFLPAESQ
jgi:hypothetical protein